MLNNQNKWEEWLLWGGVMPSLMFTDVEVPHVHVKALPKAHYCASCGEKVK